MVMCKPPLPFIVLWSTSVLGACSPQTAALGANANVAGTMCRRPALQRPERVEALRAS